MSILVNYYRMAPSEREKVTHDQAAWDSFRDRLIKAESKAFHDALDKVNVDGLSEKERYAKISEAIKRSRDPRGFNLEKDWDIVGYLLTDNIKTKEEHLPDAPLHNVIFGGLKTSVTTGYGPARYFDGKLVGETAAALVGADRKVIAGRYDPEAMKKLKIYAPPEESEKNAILKVIQELTKFFQTAAAAHEDVIKFTS